MERKTEALLWKAELLLWQCKKELHIHKVEDLKRKSVQERDEAKRAERNIFAKIWGNYEERLGKEKSEAVKAELKLEGVEKLLTTAEEKIPALEAKLKEDASLYMEDFTDAEKELLDWCCWMEQACDVLALLNRCLEEGEAARMAAYSGPGNGEENLLFQEDVQEFMEKLDEFLKTAGRVRYLPGMRVKTIRGMARNLTLNGKTLIFFRTGHPSVEIDIMDFDLKEKYGSWAVGDTLERKLKELRELESLCHDIAKEKMAEGEVLFEKMKCYPSENQDIFGFEKEKSGY